MGAQRTERTVIVVPKRECLVGLCLEARDCFRSSVSRSLASCSMGAWVSSAMRVAASTNSGWVFPQITRLDRAENQMEDVEDGRVERVKFRPVRARGQGDQQFEVCELAELHYQRGLGNVSISRVAAVIVTCRVESSSFSPKALSSATTSLMARRFRTICKPREMTRSSFCSLRCFAKHGSSSESRLRRVFPCRRVACDGQCAAQDSPKYHTPCTQPGREAGSHSR